MSGLTPGDPGEELGPLRRFEVGPDKVELRVGAVERAVSDEDDQ